jgi:CRISPR-associated protein Cas5, Hmari subtype
MKMLVFDIWGDYGHFRKFFTTSSPLTFSFPPPATIAGILGAICGFGKDEYLKLFSFEICKIGLKIASPVKKVRMGVNLINTKDFNWQPIQTEYHEPRTQIRTEFLKDPHFRIYVSHEDSRIFKMLEENLREHKSVYSPSLGLSELLANFNYLGVIEVEELKDLFAEISTPIVAGNLIDSGIVIETGKKYFKEKMPVRMNPDRVIEIYDDVIYEPGGQTIKARVKTCFRIIENGQYITFF